MNQLHLLATILFSLILGANTFSNKDAKNWGKEYPKCYGKHQSPIIITPDYKRFSTEGFSSIPQTLKLTDFCKFPKKLTIRNTGHTVEIKADWSGKPPTASGGPLPHGNYVFEKVTFRWGKKKSGEDKVDEAGVKVIAQEDVKMHMHFYKTDFKSFEEAESQKGGIAVFVKSLIVIDIGLLNQNPVMLEEYEKDLGKLDKSLMKVKSINSTAVIPPFALTRFVVSDLPIKEVLFYEGSLDYPPCSESVTWFIDRDEIIISSTLLNELKKIKLAEGDVSNIRPTQPLNNREVKLVYYHV